MKSYKGFKPFDGDGNRTYLTVAERNFFLKKAANATPEVKTFCIVLAYTGARISELLALTDDCVDFSLQCIVFKCLKKRNRAVYRAVPVPENILALLKQTHRITQEDETGSGRLWPWGRTTAWSRVRSIMDQAGISGIHANSRGLRHTFAVCAIQSGVALNMVQKWMGHADIETTALYANAVGLEEISIAECYWRGF